MIHYIYRSHLESINEINVYFIFYLVLSLCLLVCSSLRIAIGIVVIISSSLQWHSGCVSCHGRIESVLSQTPFFITFSPFFQRKTPPPQASSQNGGNHYGSHSSTFTLTTTTNNFQTLSPSANSYTPSSPCEITLYRSSHSTLTVFTTASTTKLISPTSFMPQLHAEFKISPSMSVTTTTTTTA